MHPKNWGKEAAVIETGNRGICECCAPSFLKSQMRMGSESGSETKALFCLISSAGPPGHVPSCDHRQQIKPKINGSVTMQESRKHYLSTGSQGEKGTC